MLLGGKSLGSARHWQPVLRMYITPLITSRIATRRLPPPGLPVRGIQSGSICARCGCRFSQSLASRRQRLSQAMVRSTTQRLGWTTKPFTRSDRLTISVSRSGRARSGRERETDNAVNVGGGDDAVQRGMTRTARISGRSRGVDASPPFSVSDMGGFARGFLAAQERMMDAIHAVPPQAEEHGASGRQILGQRAPLAAGAENVHHAVDQEAVCRRRACPAGSARDMRPFRSVRSLG